jgi:addiction module RelE/StbE family toxin
MRTVRYTSRFRRDYRREKSGRHDRRLDAELPETVTMLVKDEPLPRRYFDHPLGGEWSDHRDCHIQMQPTGAETPDFPDPGATMRYSDPGIVPFGRLSQ